MRLERLGHEAECKTSKRMRLRFEKVEGVRRKLSASSISERDGTEWRCRTSTSRRVSCCVDVTYRETSVASRGYVTELCASSQIFLLLLRYSRFRTPVLFLDLVLHRPRHLEQSCFVSDSCDAASCVESHPSPDLSETRQAE